MSKCIAVSFGEVVLLLFLGIFLCSFAVLVDLLLLSKMYLLSFCEVSSDVCGL